MIKHLYRKISDVLEYCFNVETSGPLANEEFEILRWLLSETFEPDNFDHASFLKRGGVVEVGPRLNFATAWNTNAVAICHACGLTKIIRIERSRRYKNVNEEIVYDRMTECLCLKPLETFETGIVPEAVYTIPLVEEGPDTLKNIPGVAMDEHDRQMYYDYFVGKCKRNPTIVEIMDLNNANSEHSRHGYFRGKQVIDGVEMPETLMEIVKSTLKVNPGNSVLAFCDNSSAIAGGFIATIMPQHPGKASAFKKRVKLYHVIFTAETHNFPSGVAPFPGAETGTGGRIRDVEATGRGGLIIASTAAYCVGNLLIPGYELPWEDKSFVYPKNLASPLEIEIQASNGASDYGNKFGESVIQGFTRSFGMRLLNGERCEWIKPIMFTGGVGQIANLHLKKGEAEKGMLIVQIGGPAYRIGFGGGAASSLVQGEQAAELDFNAVQRGDAEMEQKMNRVVRACVEMDDNNPIVSIHDQGAGGPANIQKELVEKAGGRVELRKIIVGDPTLSVLEIWVCEYQERNGLLIRPERFKEFEAICRREKVNCEVLGEVTGDGIFTVHDEQDSSTPVHLHLDDVLGNMPQKTFSDTRVKPTLKPLELSESLTVREALERVLRNVAVGSKRFLTNKVDRSVTGLIAQQQCCGPLQLTVSDVAVISQSHFPNGEEYAGAAIAIGEQPIIGLVNPKAQGRMSVGEMLTNMVWAPISSLEDIKCSANWMWAPKLPGEGAKLYDAACAMRDIMISLGIAVDGGKDSLSMATKVKESGELVKSPGQLVISGYCTMPDITKVITPDIKRPGESILILIDLSEGKCRLGGSALAQVHNQVGDECPDVEKPELLKSAFNVVQELIDKNLILAGHDRSDGGLITTVLEMAFAGNCGLNFKVFCSPKELLAKLFSEELGMVIECLPEDEGEILDLLDDNGLTYHFLGETSEEKVITIKQIDGMYYHDEIVREITSETVFSEDMRVLRQIWEETSYQLERLQSNPKTAEEEKENIFDRKRPAFNLSFAPELTAKKWLNATDKPKVAIIREEGSNSDREMTSAFYMAGFEPWDVTMTDLTEDRITLDQFKGIAFVGGFSYADVLDSAKGWAGVIRFNPKLWEQFERFYCRPDTFSLGVCNGCQLMALLGWVPWRGFSSTSQPRFIHNSSGRFESRFSTVKILPSPAIMLKGMEGSTLGIHVAHGEGRLYLPKGKTLNGVIKNQLAPICYADDEGEITIKYPFNPNGSTNGIAALCSPDGRHLAIMPHPERTFLKWQWHYMPEEWKKNLKASPWLKMFQNAREWCG